MNTLYTYENDWLVMNGEKVLYCQGNTPEQMQLVVAEYQAMADAPKTELPFPEMVTTSVRKTAEEWCLSQGFSTFDLLNLNRIEIILKTNNITIPPKSTAFETWIFQTQMAYASGAEYTNAPVTMKELLEELYPILNTLQQA
jgi:hypothetical protein